MKYILLVICLFSAPALFAQQKLALIKDYNYGGLRARDTGIIVEDFTEGLAPFMIKNNNPFAYELNQVGFVDSTGNIVIKPKYINCSNFENGLALVQDKLSKVGVINKAGKEVVQPDYDNIQRCDNGLLFARKQGDWILLDATGTPLAPSGRYSKFATPPPVYREADDTPRPEFKWQVLYFKPSVRFKQYIGVKAGSKWAVINRTGKEIVPPTFDGIGIFNGPFAIVLAGKKFGVTDTLGNLVIPAIYDKVELTDSYFAVVTLNHKTGVLKTAGAKPAIPLIYDKIRAAQTNTFLVYQGTSCGVVTVRNKIIIPINYRYISVFGSGYLVTAPPEEGQYGTRQALFNAKGKQLTPLVYDRYNVKGVVLDMGNDLDTLGYMVYNRQKDKFLHYEKIIDEGHDYYNDRQLVYVRGENMGLMDTSGSEVTKAIYDEIRVASLQNHHNVIFAMRDGKWGVINSSGKTIVNFEYSEFGFSPLNFSWLKKDVGYTLLFDDSTAPSPETYDRIYRGNAGSWVYTQPVVIPVSINKKWGFADSRGRQLTPVKYDDYYGNAGNLAHIMPVETGGKWGFLNRYFKEITPLKYDGYNQFQQGVSMVSTDKKWGLIDTTGREIVPCIYDGIQINYKGLILITKNKLHGLMDFSGRVVLEPLYDDLYILDQQFDYKNNWYQVKMHGKVGLIDANGRETIPCVYDLIYFKRADENMLAKKDGAWGMIDKFNRVVVPFKYQSVTEITFPRSNRSPVYIVKQNGKDGIVTETGQQVLPFDYEEIQVFADWRHNSGKSLICAKKGGFYGLVNWQGKVVAPFIYKNLYQNGLNFMVTTDKTGFIDWDGKVVVPVIYDFISSAPNESFYLASKDKKITVMKPDGHIMYDAAFDSYDFLLGGYTIIYAAVIKDGKTGLLDCDGQLIYPCIYKDIKFVDGSVTLEKF